MIDGRALGIYAASVSQRAWICTLVVYTRIIVLALNVRPTTGNAYQSLADLATPAVFVPSAE